MGVGFLLLASFFLTFFTVFLATAAAAPHLLNEPQAGLSGAFAGIPLGILAGAVVLACVVMILRRWGWR